MEYRQRVLHKLGCQYDCSYMLISCSHVITPLSLPYVVWFLESTVQFFLHRSARALGIESYERTNRRCMRFRYFVNMQKENQRQMQWIRAREREFGTKNL